jgi:phosphotransferase system  glucose/maltose/N-acetylglucosamine-specific IIC component
MVRVDVQKIANLFLIFVLVAAVLALIIGLFVSIRTSNHKKGFFGTLIASLVFLIGIVSWYDKASSNVFMGTLPWILNVVAVILVWPIYLIIIYFVFKKITKDKITKNEKISS